MKTTETILKQPMPKTLKPEIRKIGYALVLIGVIALVHAWQNIITGESTLWELLFLFIGLIATLGGINLVIRRAKQTELPFTADQPPEKVK